jgi:hypothetical protein
MFGTFCLQFCCGFVSIYNLLVYLGKLIFKTVGAQLMKNLCDIKDLRSRHNDIILAKFKRGESLSQHSSMSSWFPPRPVVKKNIADLNRVYNSSIKMKPKFTNLSFIKLSK